MVTVLINVTKPSVDCGSPRRTRERATGQARVLRLPSSEGFGISFSCGLTPSPPAPLPRWGEGSRFRQRYVRTKQAARSSDLQRSIRTSSYLNHDRSQVATGARAPGEEKITTGTLKQTE